MQSNVGRTARVSPTFHLDYDGPDCPSTSSDNVICLATEALINSIECLGAIEIYFSIYLCVYLSIDLLM